MKDILIVNKSSSKRSSIKTNFEKAGYLVVGEAENGKRALELAKKLKPDIIIIGNILPDMFGFEVQQNLAINGIYSNTIMVSTIKTDSNIKTIKRLSAVDYSSNLFKPKQLTETVDLLNSLPIAC
jgi:two-component system chemotaxis response regulator CheY